VEKNVALHYFMSRQSATVPVALATELLAGFDADSPLVRQVITEAKIAPAVLRSAGARLTIEQFSALYRQLALALDDETPGFFSRPLRRGTLKFLCLSLFGAGNLGSALHRFAGYFRLLLDDIGFDVVREGGRTRIALADFLRHAPANWLYVPFADRMLTHRMRDHLESHLDGANCVASTAKALHLLVRTLSRRLAEEGTTFQAVKDALRRDIAIVQLIKTDLTIGAIGAALGFDDPATFNRAFKSWTGSAPGTYRRRGPGQARPNAELAAKIIGDKLSSA
jgi:AraC-like DNA-binding protein